MRVTIVGGGITGVAAALRLRDLAGPDLEIVLIDQDSALGGKLRTGTFAGAPTETCADAFLMHAADGTPSPVAAFARRVGLADALRHPTVPQAALVCQGALKPIPRGTLIGVPGDLDAVDAVATPDRDADRDEGHPLLAVDEDIAVGELVRSRFGDDVVRRLVDPMLGGVYAGRADDLSLRATMPALCAAATSAHTLVGAVRAALDGQRRPPGAPVFGTIEGGLSRLVEAGLAAAGPRVLTGTTVRALHRTEDGRWRLTLDPTSASAPASGPAALDADAVLLAVPARSANRLLAEAAPESAELLGAVDYASVALVALALPPSVELPEISGFLVPADEGFAVKAVTFVTTKWGHLRRPDGTVVLRASLGRYGDAGILANTDHDLVEVVRAELPKLLGMALPAPLAATVVRWDDCLPQYAPGHVSRVARARQALPAGLTVAGAACDGVGIPACVGSGERAAATLWTALTGLKGW